MIEINLIPDVKQALLKAQRIRNLVISTSIIVSIAAVGVVVLLLVYMYGVQSVRNVVLDGQIKDKYATLSKVDDLSKIITIQNQLKTVSSLNEKKVLASRTFDVVSAVTPPDDSSLSFSQISLSPATDESSSSGTSASASTSTTSSTNSTSSSNGGGSLRLDGQTSSYDSMEAFKKRIANTSFEYVVDGKTTLIPIASSISTSDISYGDSSDGSKVLRFTLTFDYPAELFSSKTAGQQVVFKLTTNGNVTDSYLGIPKFVERSTTDEGTK